MGESPIIEPKILKGFRDLLPDQELTRRRSIRILEDVMISYGFVPIDTPALEYTQVLLGKGGGETDKQIYRFLDNGQRDVALRFDLTVPLARFLAAHRLELYLPFRRYHFAKVWRGENSQRGRYREFMQCDFDLVGVDSAGADFEILLVMQAAFKAIGVSKVRFHLNHRGLFNRFLERQGIADRLGEILRRVDKFKKIGPEATRQLLVELVPTAAAQQILDFIQVGGSNRAIVDQLEHLAGGPGEDGGRLRAVLALAQQLGIGESIVLDPSITRGLDYYTGLVYETFLVDLPAIGSVCSGGRYNDLAGLYGKEALPGVGSSIGLDRLLAALEELAQLDSAPRSTTVLVFCQDETKLGHYHAIAQAARLAGIAAEVYPSVKKLSIQFAYAEKKRIPFGIMVGGLANDNLSLRNLATRQNFETTSLEQLLKQINQSIG